MAWLIIAPRHLTNHEVIFTLQDLWDLVEFNPCYGWECFWLMHLLQLHWNDCKTRGCREAVALSDASTAPDAVPWAGQALEKSWRNFRPFQTAPALLRPDLPLVGIFSIVGKLSRTGDVEKWEGGKGNTSVQQKQNCSVWTGSGQSFKPGSWSLNLTGSKSSGTALNFFFCYNFLL